MNRLGTLLLASILTAFGAHAAEVTRVATAVDDDTPFVMYLDLSYELAHENSTLFRQWHANGTLTELPELLYRNSDSRLLIDAHIGIYKDMELHYSVPYIFDIDESWSFSNSTSSATSTIANNCINADGTITDPGCPLNGTSVPLFAVPASSHRHGLGNMTFGLAWAPFTQKKDDTKPDWLLGFDYTAPTATAINPTVPTSTGNPGNVGDGTHQYKFFTALSRRYGPAEPYVKVQYSFPFQGPGYYSNCQNLSAGDSAAPGNCFQGPWTKSETGIKMPQVGMAEFGVELSPYREPNGPGHFTIDLRGVVNYIGPGRYYNELSYQMTKLLWTDDYAQIGGRLGLIAQASSWVAFKLYTGILYNTEHTITNEAPGKDISGTGSVNLTQGSLDINPNFDYRVDAPGRQFRVNDSFLFELKATISLIF
jgi:hypothetical protein